jgi:hypothetical protein
MTKANRRSPYVALAVATPTITSALGIDGGAIFQISAVEDLGLGSRAIGTAFGLGVLSVPLQLWAARTPLWRARRNLRLFFAFAAGGCWLMAVLLALVDRRTAPAVIALGLTVIAEIALSVLYATSWQPLLAHGLPSDIRQRVNARGRAAGGLLLAAALVGFGATKGVGRVLFLFTAGAIAAGLSIAARSLTVPDRPSAEPGMTKGAESRASLPQEMRAIYFALGAAAFATWPLFLVYVRQVLWPSANLGLVGALQLGGSLAAALAWRSSAGDVMRRAVWAAGGLTAGAAVLAAIGAPVDGPLEVSALILAVGLAAGSTTTLLLALLESAHRIVDDRSSVKALTIYDVVASTAFQTALFVGGFVVAAAVHHADWRVDPYRIFLLLSAANVLFAVHRLKRQG